MHVTTNNFRLICTLPHTIFLTFAHYCTLFSFFCTLLNIIFFLYTLAQTNLLPGAHNSPLCTLLHPNFLQCAHYFPSLCTLPHIISFLLHTTAHYFPFICTYPAFFFIILRESKHCQNFQTFLKLTFAIAGRFFQSEYIKNRKIKKYIYDNNRGEQLMCHDHDGNCIKI